MVDHHEGFRRIRDRIAAAEAKAGRAAGSVTLIAVSKTFGPEAIIPVIADGQRVFGENRVQEAKAKWPALRAETPGLELHIIGPLQTNKAAEAVALAEAIHTLDRPKLARILAEEMARQKRAPKLFVQVNTGEEAQKAGIAPAHTAEFIRQCREEFGLTLEGLMCIPPVDADPARHFAMLRDLAARHGLASLSMGMSADFETAIAHGATHVRVGSAIFGLR